MIFFIISVVIAILAVLGLRLQAREYYRRVRAKQALIKTIRAKLD